jgi:hypothetical protein
VESAQFRNEQGMGTHEVEEPVATDFDAVPGEIFPYQPMEFSSSGALGNIRIGNLSIIQTEASIIVGRNMSNYLKTMKY